MKKLLLNLLCVASLGAPAFANTYELPDEKPVASVTIPGTWKPSQYEDGVEATSDDGEVYIAIEATDTKNVKDSMDEALKYLKKKGVKVKEASAKTEEMKLNGMDVVDISWDGKDEDGDCKISLSVIAATNNKGLLLIYWASPEGEKKNKKELTKIAQSIKPLGKAAKSETSEKTEKSEKSDKSED